MPRVNVKGVGMVDLPDGMSREEMLNILRGRYSPQAGSLRADPVIGSFENADLTPRAMPVEPTFAQMIGQGVESGFSGMGFTDATSRKMGGMATTASEFAPIVGAMQAGSDAGKDLKQQNYLGAIGNTALGAMEVNPVGDAMFDTAMVIGAGAKEFRHDLADKAKEIYNSIPDNFSFRQKQDMTFNRMVNDYDVPMYVGADGQVRQYAENIVDNDKIDLSQNNLFDAMGDQGAFVRNYPELAKSKALQTEKGMDGFGFYSPTNNQVGISADIPKNKQVSTLFHEAQHAIQDSDGLMAGTNPDTMEFNWNIETKKLADDRNENYTSALNDAEIAKQNSGKEGLLKMLSQAGKQREIERLTDYLKNYSQGGSLSGNWKNIRESAQYLASDSQGRLGSDWREISDAVSTMKKGTNKAKKNAMIEEFIIRAISKGKEKLDPVLQEAIDAMPVKDKTASISRKINKINKEMKPLLDRVDETKTDYELTDALKDKYYAYESAGGEIEARQAQSMMNVPMDELKRKPPTSFMVDRSGRPINNPLRIDVRDFMGGDTGYTYSVIKDSGEPLRATTEHIYKASNNPKSMSLLDSIDDRQKRAIDMGFNPDETYYHGALQDIAEFDLDEASPEGHFGKGIYVTSGADDASYNYASVSGADQENKIALLAENYADENEIDYDEAKKIITDEFAGNQGVVYPTNIKTQKPFDLTDDDVVLNYELPEYDWEDYLDEADGDEDYARDLAQEASMYDEPSGDLAEFLSNFELNAREFNDDSVYQFIDEVRERAYDYGGITPRELDDIFRSHDFYMEDDEGRLINNEIFRQSIEDTGFDSVIHDADIFQGMKNTDGQKHVILFKPNQIRSVNAKFDKEKSGSGNLLAGVAGIGLLSALPTEDDDEL